MDVLGALGDDGDQRVDRCPDDQRAQPGPMKEHGEMVSTRRPSCRRPRGWSWRCAAGGTPDDVRCSGRPPHRGASSPTPSQNGPTIRLRDRATGGRPRPSCRRRPGCPPGAPRSSPPRGRRARAARTVRGGAPPMPSSRTSTRSMSSPPRLPPRPRRARVLDHVGQRLRHDEVRARLELRRDLVRRSCRGGHRQLARATPASSIAVAEPPRVRVAGRIPGRAAQLLVCPLGGPS